MLQSAALLGFSRMDRNVRLGQLPTDVGQAQCAIST